jgi:hypothetical protein
MPKVELAPATGETGRQLQPLLGELRRLGYEVGAPERLVQTGRRHRDAVSVLLDWLPRLSDPAAKKSLVRGLCECKT